MVSFRLLQCDGGWEWIKLPDNMVLKFTRESDTLEFHASLRDIVIYAVMVREKEYGEKVFGMDGIAWIRPAPGDRPGMVEIGAADLGEVIPHEDAIDAVQSLLFDAFARHDEYQPEERSDALRLLNNDLERRELPPVADELYAEYLERTG